MRNSEVVSILQMVGLKPDSVPSSVPEDVVAHIEILVRHAGYKAGLQAATKWRSNYDITKPYTAVLGDFIEDQITFRDREGVDKSIYHDMHRTLAILEGATGYDLTSKKPSIRANLFFLTAVLNDIKNYVKAPSLAPEEIVDDVDDTVANQIPSVFAY